MLSNLSPVLVLTAFCISSTSFANEYESYKKALARLTEPQPSPSVTSVASGFGAGDKQLFIGVSYSDRDMQTKIDGDNDGSIIVGYGFGNPDVAYGYEVAVGITSVSTSFWGDGKFGDEGNINFKLHRRFTPLFNGDIASWSVGVSNLAGWGGPTEMPANYYFAFSESGTLDPYGLYAGSVTLGYGTAVASDESEGGFFGGLAVARSIYNISLSSIHDEVHVSGSARIPILKDLLVTVTRADAFNNRDSERNIFSIGYNLQLGG